jgi:hypothetical protein
MVGALTESKPPCHHGLLCVVLRWVISKKSHQLALHIFLRTYEPAFASRSSSVEGEVGAGTEVPLEDRSGIDFNPWTVDPLRLFPFPLGFPPGLALFSLGLALVPPHFAH